MKKKRILLIILFIALIILALLYANERLNYQKQSETTLNSLSNAMADETDSMTNLAYGISEGISKENTQVFFTEVLIDISDVKVLLIASRYARGLSKKEVNNMLELINFHEYLNQEMLTMSFQFSKNGMLSEDQSNDLDTLRLMFYDTRSKLIENDNRFHSWYTSIMEYEGKFSETGLIIKYYQ